MRIESQKELGRSREDKRRVPRNGSKIILILYLVAKSSARLD